MADNYVLSARITGDSSGFQKALESAEKKLSSFEAKTKSFSNKMSSLGKSFTNIGDKLTNKITKPALIATTALGGITLGKGFSRLTKIDDARAKLKGLGHDAEAITEIMKSANASVKNTSYGLDEAATTAASAVAAGIKPGKELTRYLSLTADAAAIAGVEMSGMGSVFNKVQTSQKAYNEELKQLADKGVPIYQWLADEAGTTADKIKEMASDGEISSKMFLSAIEKNIGGAAKIMGESSFTAALSNIGAAIGRIGANFLDAGGKGGGFFSQLKPLMVEFRDYLGAIEDKAADLGVKFGETFGKCVSKLREMKERFDKLPESMQKVITNTGLMGLGFAVSIGPVMKYLGPVVRGSGKLAEILGKISGTSMGTLEKMPKTLSNINDRVKVVGGDFLDLGKAMLYPFNGFGNAVGNILSKAFGKIKSVTTTGINKITSSATQGFIKKFPNMAAKIEIGFEELTSYLGSWAGKISAPLKKVLGHAARFGTKFLSFMNISAGIGVLLVGLGLLSTVFGDRINSFLQMAKEKGPVIITKLCDGIASNFPSLIAKGGEIVLNLINAITANLPAIAGGGMLIIASLITGVGQQLPTIIPAAAEMIMTLFNALIVNLPVIIDAGIQLLEGLGKGLTDAIPKLVEKVPIVITSLITTIISKLPQIIITGGKVLVALGLGLLQAIPQLIARIPEIVNAIKEAFINVDWWGIGGRIIKGIASGVIGFGGVLLDAMKAAAKVAVNGLISVVNWGIGKANKVPGVNIPNIPYLLHGTDNWQGGFAYMNESGRGELVNLPNGSQVISHDISVRYAKEAARTTSSVESLDVEGILDGVVIQVINNTNVDGTPLKETVSDYTIRKIGNQQRIAMRARGGYA